MARTPILFLLFACQITLAQSPKVIGYFPTYRFSWTNSIDFSKLTHVNIAFANPDSLGNLSCDGSNIDPVVAKAKQNGCKVFVSLAGGYLTPSVEANWDKLALPANRAGFIAKIVQYVQTHQLDGVDLDLEWQYVKSWYSPFVLELKAALNTAGLPLTVALPGSYRYPAISNSALNAFDWINMMIYDLRGPWDESNPGQHAPYDWTVQCVQYWKDQQHVPAQKLTLGVPFYGYDFGVSPVVAFNYRGIVAQDPANAFRDEIGLKYWNGIPTIQAKTELALQTVAGVMIWEIGQDAFGADAQYSLLKAIDEVIDQHAVSTNEIVEGDFRLYPNPATDRIRFRFDRSKPVFAAILDMQGRLIMHLDPNAESFSISDLTPGMYCFQLRCDDRTFTNRFVKL